MSSSFIGNILKTRRKELNLSVKDVLEQLQNFGIDISDKTLYGWESGHRQPDADTFLILCNIYQISTITGIQKIPKISSGQNIENAPSDFSEEAKKIAKDYDKLDARGKGAVKAIMEYEGKAEAAAPQKQAAGRPKVVPLPKVKRAHGFTEIEVFDQPAAAGLGNPVDIPPSHTEQYPSDYVPPKTNFGVLISGTSMEPKIPDGSTVFVQATPALDNGEIGIFVLDGKSYCKQLKKDEETVILHSLNPDAEDVDVPPLSELRTLGRVLGGYDPRTKDMI